MLKDINPKKILVVKPSALGDIVHSFPFLNALSKRFPEAQIDWAVAKGLHPLLENHPMLNKIWIIDKGNWKKLSRLNTTYKELRKLVADLKNEKYDLVIDLQGLMRSGIITKMTKCKYRVGFKAAREGANLFYTHKIPCKWSEMHAIDRYLKIAEALGCTIDKVENTFTSFNENPPIMSELPDEYIIIAPSAGKEANRWPADRFGKLAAKLPLPVVVVSHKADTHVVDELVSHSDGKAISLAGRTNIMELAAVIKKAKFFISNDTGPMHIAAALNIPVFAIFGPSNSQKTGPYGDIHTIISVNAPCAPCYAKKKCSHWKCMETLTIDKVLEVINKKLNT
jgi:lipopolysaccharide heptosyltransferase I